MREICVPISDFGDDEIAEVSLTVGQRKICYSYRVESFLWNLEGSLPGEKETGEHQTTFKQITMLRSTLAEYDKNWELVQIFTPRKGASHIQVLFRKRTNNNAIENS